MSTTGRRALVAVAALVLGAALLLLRRPAADGLLRLVTEVEKLGAWGPIAMTGALAAGIPLCVPAAPLLMAAGALLGPLLGILCGALGLALGGALSFLLGRRLLRERIEERLAAQTGFAVMNKALRQEGVRGVVLIRLSPVLPAWLINYGLGVSRVSWRQYWLSSISVLPTVALYALAGAGLGDLASLESGVEPPRGPGYYFLLGGGIVATLAASLLLGRRARRILQEMEE